MVKRRMRMKPDITRVRVSLKPAAPTQNEVSLGRSNEKNEWNTEVKEMGYLINETTKEERERIVADSLGNIEANCDGCMAGLAEMYQDYIDGKKELREINMEFNARYIKGDDMPGRKSCMEYQIWMVTNGAERI